jgi:hypothetical protein
MCRCWADGKTRTLPPHAEHVELDDEGWVGLRLDWLAHQEEHEAFARWKASCCPHPDMEAASEWISNWAGYRAFQAALAQLGWELFPVLEARLPETNGGMMPAAACATALVELSRFTELVSSSRATFLIDADTGEELYEYVPQYKGVFLLAGSEGIDVGVDPHGLFVVTRESPPRDLFRAMYVEQTAIERNEIGDPIRVRLVCLDTGRPSDPMPPIHGAEIPWPDGRSQDDAGRRRFACPRHLRVVTRSLHAADFDHILGALRRVFEAAVATGNSVRWT